VVAACVAHAVRDHPAACAALTDALAVDRERTVSQMFFQTVFVALVLLALGLALCFAGYYFFVILLPIFGFFAGFLLTAQVIQELFGGGFLATISSWVFGLVVGLLCAVLAYLFYVVAVVVLAATIGYEVGVGILAGLGVSMGFLLFLAGLIAAVVLTVVVLLLGVPKLLIVVLTAASGAGMLLSGILLSLGRIALEELQWGIIGTFLRTSWFWSLVFVLITALGVVVQLYLAQEYALQSYSRVSAPSPTSDRSPPPWPTGGGTATA
jgi:hypothetical protein